MAGDEGFEPPNGGTRTHCLTTWRIPNGLHDFSTIWPKKQNAPGAAASRASLERLVEAEKAQARLDDCVGIDFLVGMIMIQVGYVRLEIEIVVEIVCVDIFCIIDAV